MTNFSKSERFLLGLLVFAGIFFIIIARRPDILFFAQPWAEDGKFWVSEIYNNGFWHSVLYPQNGYYQTISRFTYGFSLLFGISKAAYVANIIAVLIRALFMMFILSSRMKFINIKYRIVAVVYFLLMPNAAEGYVNITNIHWYLSLYLMSVLIAEKPETTAWKTHDLVVLFISALSGPFIVFIAPCLLIKRIYERGGLIAAIKGINAFDGLAIAIFVVQTAAIVLSSESGRSTAPLGASFGLLATIVSYRVIAGSFFPDQVTKFLGSMTAVNIIFFVALVIILAVSFFREGWRFKIAVLFPVLMLGFALAKPMMSLDHPQWEEFLKPGGGARYFFVTNFAFFCMILFFISKAREASTKLILLLMIIISPILLLSFEMRPLADVGYHEDIAKFQTLPSGQEMDIRINPPGWTMSLIKK